MNTRKCEKEKISNCRSPFSCLACRSQTSEVFCGLFGSIGEGAASDLKRLRIRLSLAQTKE